MTYQPAVQLSRTFYAMAIIAFGIQHFLIGDFIAGRPPVWPTAISGQLIFAYTSGLVFILSGITVFINKHARLSLVITGTIILLWSGLRNCYEIMVTPTYGALLTNTCKALVLGTGAFIVAQTYAVERSSPLLNKWITRLALAGNYVMGFFLLIAGVQHFIFAEFVQFLVPAWIPGAVFWTYLSGIALAAAGVGILTGIKAMWATLLAGGMVLAWVLLLHLPRAIVQANQNEWTAVFEALAVSGILFLLANTHRKN